MAAHRERRRKNLVQFSSPRRSRPTTSPRSHAPAIRKSNPTMRSTPWRARPLHQRHCCLPRKGCCGAQRRCPGGVAEQLSRSGSSAAPASARPASPARRSTPSGVDRGDLKLVALEENWFSSQAIDFAVNLPPGRVRGWGRCQIPQAFDRTNTSNHTKAARGAPTCGSLHLEVLRRGLPLVCNLFVLDLLTLVEGRQTGPLYRRNVDENVLAAAFG